MRFLSFERNKIRISPLDGATGKSDVREEDISVMNGICFERVFWFLRSIGIEKIRQSNGGKVAEIGFKEIENCREQF